MFSINLICALLDVFDLRSLHSTMFSINLQSTSGFFSFCSLYIPLCFLLIRMESLQEEIEKLSLHSTMFSINPPKTASGCRSDITLHSTMFSINPKEKYQQVAQAHLYIPLCFLLICGGTSKICLYRWSFTFHYVFY